MLIENIVQDPSDREERATHHGGWFTQCHTASVRRKGTRGGLIFSGCGERCWSPISNHDSASNSCSKPKPTSSTCITRFCRVSISKTRRSASTSSTAPTSLRSDTTVPLSDTYCRETITDPEGTLAVSDASAEGWEGDPAYETFGFESYLGTTISVDDELYGTLCFADTAARDDPINDKEKALVEMHGQWVEYTMTHWGESSFREARIDAIEGRAVSSDAIDSMMDALESRTRRVVLATLLDTSETSLATLERRASGTSSDLPDQRPPLARRRAEPVQLPAVDDDHVTPTANSSSTVTLSRGAAPASGLRRRRRRRGPLAIGPRRARRRRRRAAGESARRSASTRPLRRRCRAP